VVGASPQPGDDARSSLWDLVTCGADVGVLGSDVPDDMVPALGSSGATGPVVSGLYLPGSPLFPPLPINWWRKGDEVEYVCLRVATTERLLHETLVLVD
jgi:hypothetical protein